MDVEIASEYRYRDFILPEDALFVVVSQSGKAGGYHLRRCVRQSAEALEPFPLPT